MQLKQMICMALDMQEELLKSDNLKSVRIHVNYRDNLPFEVEITPSTKKVNADQLNKLLTKQMARDKIDTMRR